jgi:phosphomannomutase
VEAYGLREFKDFKPRMMHTFDGTKISFAPSGFILFRPSGTEPVLRIYAETENLNKTLKLLEAGRDLLRKKTDLLEG